MSSIDRRTFVSRCLGCTTGLTLLAIPGFTAAVPASQEGKSKEQILKELGEKVDKYLPMYMSCALSSFAALNDQFKLGADDAALRALMPFTGGLALRGETCGAVSGSLLAIGYAFESVKRQEHRMPGASMEYGGRFFEGFTKEFGSTRCKGVLEHQYGRSYDFLNPEEQKQFMEASEKSNKCMEVVKKAVSIAGEIILGAEAP